MNKNNLIITIIIALIVGGLSFYGGTLYQKGKTPSIGSRQFQNGDRPSGMQGRQNGQPVSGEITSIENNSITVKTQDGSSKIVIYSDSTKVNKTSEATKDDLKVGEQIMVVGTTGTDGTVTAQSVSLGGNFFRGMSNGQ
jgi:ribosomal protein S1